MQENFVQKYYGVDQLSNPDITAAASATSPRHGARASVRDAAAATTKTAPPKSSAGSSHECAWRRIDDDWLDSAGEFALQLDSYTNNTSLAMAIELKGTGKVLLFVADAQAGNWISWAGLSWEV